MISAENIYKSFGGVEILKGVNFSAKRAEILSIVGASGAGKTTFLQILGSLSRPDRGKVTLDGTDIFSLDDTNLAAFRNRRIGFVFQSHCLLPEFTALENVCLPAFIARTPRQEVLARAQELLQFLNLGHRFDHKPSQLSGGEQQRVAVARALINRPAVVLADEPSGNLDSKNKEELHDFFFALRERYGQTIVLVTHDPALAKRCDRSLVMQDGQFA